MIEFIVPEEMVENCVRILEEEDVEPKLAIYLHKLLVESVEPTTKQKNTRIQF